LQTSITLVLEHVDPELARAHHELYPERIPEQIPFSLIVAYVVPEPDDELKAMMRGLWKLYPDCPPYGRPGSDPPPHATLTRYANPANASFAEAKKRVEPLLPVHSRVTEATLQEEYELDRMRIRETFPFRGGV
jgi:hypothetical protein